MTGSVFTSGNTPVVGNPPLRNSSTWGWETSLVQKLLHLDGGSGTVTTTVKQGTRSLLRGRGSNDSTGKSGTPVEVPHVLRHWTSTGKRRGYAGWGYNLCVYTVKRRNVGLDNTHLNWDVQNPTTDVHS